MSKVTLEKVFTKVKETKFGPKLSVGLKVKEASVEDINGIKVQVNDRYINGWFKQDYVFPHKEGEEIEILLTTRGEYLDFTLPEIAAQKRGGDPSLGPRVAKLEKQISEIIAHLKIEEEEILEDPNDF